MPFLSPAKLLVILVVALIVLGPDKLPKMAKQIGSLWGDFRKFRERLESDVRGTFPDLPSTDTIAQAVRSPALVPRQPGRLPQRRERDDIRGGPPAPKYLTCRATPYSRRRSPTGRPVPSRPPRRPRASPRCSIVDPGGIVHQVRSNGRAIPDDPGMN